jgi:hypothetical protein
VDIIDAQNWQVPYLFIQPIAVAHARVHQSKSSTTSEITTSNKVSKTPLLHMLPPIDWFFVADSTKFLHLICTLSDSPLLVTLVNRYPSCHVTITDY